MLQMTHKHLSIPSEEQNCKESDLKKFSIFRDVRDEIDSGYKYKEHSFKINLACCFKC